MSIKPSDQHTLEDLYFKYKATYGGEKQDYFALVYLRRRFRRDIEELAYRVSFGGNDYGLDAYHIDHEANNLYIYQFKWSENHGLFKNSMVRLTDEGVERIFGNPKQDPSQNQFLMYLRKELNEAREQIHRVYIHFVFKGDVNECEKSEGLNARREDLEGKAHTFADTYFGRETEIQVDFISDRPGTKGPPPSQSYEINLPNFIEIGYQPFAMYVGFVPLYELHRIYSALREQLFDRNIRGALSADNTPNKRIREALDRIVLKCTEGPSVFSFRHNGVTIAAEKAIAIDGRLRLYMPRVLNGAQTISSVDLFLLQHAGNPLLKQNRDRFESISILTKIIIAESPSDFVTSVAISNNQQNPVPPWALRAMDRRQVDLADKFREELGIFYSRQEGVFKNLTDEDKEQLGIDDDKDMRIRLLAQTLLAAQGDVYNMGRLPEVFESQQLYERAFKASYDSVDARSIVLGYKIGLMIGRAMERLKEKTPNKYVAAVPKARNLVWALLIQAFLNDKKYSHYRELYGESLRKDYALGDVIKQMAAARVWPLLRGILESQHFADKVGQNRYEFLRTADAFKRTMNLASDQFAWQKRWFS